MGVDVIYLLGPEAGVLQYVLHDSHRTVTVFRWGAYVVGIAGLAEPGQLADDLRPPFPRVLEFFEDQDARSFAHDEAVPVQVVRPGSRSRVVVAGGKGSHRGESGD